MPGARDYIFNAFMHAASCCRLRHFRGHGVHSPFAYGLVRNIYMKRRHLPAKGSVYSALREHGGTVRQASLIQALYDYLACRQCCIDAEPVAESPAREDGGSMEVFTTATTVGNETLPAPGHIVCLLSCQRKSSLPRVYEGGKQPQRNEHRLSDSHLSFRFRRPEQ